MHPRAVYSNIAEYTSKCGNASWRALALSQHLLFTLPAPLQTTGENKNAVRSIMVRF